MQTFVYAHILDYIIYDSHQRYDIKKLDGIVDVKINAYYAFADLGLIETVIEQKRIKPDQDEKQIAYRRTSTHYGSELILITGDSCDNSTMQLLRNSIWLLDVNITHIYDGDFATNRVFVALKSTRAYKAHESPRSFLSPLISLDTNLVRNVVNLKGARPKTPAVSFGLVSIPDEEFKKSFRGMYCYLKNNLEFIDSDSRSTCLIKEDYERFFLKKKVTPCYVAREIGVKPKYNFGPGETDGLWEDWSDCELLKKFRKRSKMK